MSHIHTTLSSSLPSKTTKFHHLPFLSPPLPPNFTHLNNTKRAVTVILRATSSDNFSPSIEQIDGQKKGFDQSERLSSGSEVVRRFYDGVNRHELADVEDLIAVNCVYEDLVFPSPFVGRKSILEFFGKFIDYVSTDLQFVIDAISEEDSSAVGVTWHLEWKGKPFPFSKGCSFYQLAIVNGSRQIIYARDSVEPAIKPGESALVAIRGVTWLLQRFPNLADRL